jgi:proliferating cell nuclear antigen
MDNKSEYVFYARTVKASPIRTLVDAVKDILTEVNLEIDAAGIKIMAMDGTHTILVHMRLYADRFDEFLCTEKSILGIDFVKLLLLLLKKLVSQP